MTIKFKHITLEPKPSLTRFLEEMSKWGSIGSYFYEPRQKPKTVSLSLDTSIRELADFLEQNSSIKDYKGFDSLRFNILNKLEFKASIATKYLQGGIYGCSTTNETDALNIATQMINNIFPMPDSSDMSIYDDFAAFKMTPNGWCSLAKGGINWCYIVRDPYLCRWWLVYFNSDS